MNLLTYEIAIVSILGHNKSNSIYLYTGAERNPRLLQRRKYLLDLKITCFQTRHTYIHLRTAATYGLRCKP